MRSRTAFIIIIHIVLIFFSIGCTSRLINNPEIKRNIWSLETGPISGGHFYCVDVGDFNGDTITDIAGGSFEPGGIMVWLGKGDGSWIKISSPAEDCEVHSIAVADLNNDTFSDIVASSEGSFQGINVWLSKGDGSWNESVTIDSDKGFQSVKIADVNKDGLSDIIAANESTGLRGGVRVWLNQGDGTWSPILGPERAGMFKDVEVADLNNDGNVDIIANSIGHKGSIKIWYGDGNGNWSPSVDLDIKGYNLGLTTGDLNQDGWTDIIATVYYQGIYIFYNNNAFFSKPKQIGKKASFWDVILMDCNNDGRKDILASSIEADGILAWYSSGNKKWKAVDIGLPRNQLYYGLNTADFNLDELSDLLVASYSEGIHLWLQTSNGKVVILKKEDFQFKPPKKQPKKKEQLHIVDENKTFTTVMGYPEYRIASEDKLNISIWIGQEKKELEAKVKTNGEIYIPYLGLGNVKAEGLSSMQLKETMEEKLKNFLKKPVVEVEIIEYVGRKVTLTGEVRTYRGIESGTGVYPLKGKTRALEFISEHGGATEKGNISQVRLLREGKVYIFNLFKAISQGDEKENPILDDGDTIYIPSLLTTDNRVLVLGEVMRPGIINYTGEISLLDAVSMAGSFSKDAVKHKVFIVRGNINKPEVFEANLKDVIQKGNLTQNVVLQNGDIVYVPRRFIAKLDDFFKIILPSLRTIQTIYILHRFATDS